MELTDEDLARVIAFITELETTPPPEAERVRKLRQAPRPNWQALDMAALDRAYKRFWLAQTGSARRHFTERLGPGFRAIIREDMASILEYCRHVLADQRDYGTWPRPDACRLLAARLADCNRYDLARRVEKGFQMQTIRSLPTPDKATAGATVSSNHG